MAINVSDLVTNLKPFVLKWIQEYAVSGGGGASSTGTAGTPDAPSNSQYLVLALDPNLSAERRFVPSGLGLSGGDGGAGGDYTLTLTSSSNPGAAASILASASSGALTLTGFNGGAASTASTSWTTAGWSNRVALAQGAAVVWEKGASGSARGIGSTSNGILYISRSTASDNSAAITYDAAIDTSGNLGVGTSTGTISARVHSLSTTEQLRLGYDTSNYVSLAVSSGGNLTLTPTGSQFNLPTTTTLRSSNYASQTTGWGISGAGEADFRYLFVDEMHAKSFIADLEQALAGGQIISKSVAMVSQTFTAPSAGNTATLWVRDLPSAANMAAFVSGDTVRLRTFSRSSGSLSISDCWGVVTSYSDGSGANEGQQSWTFTRSSGGNAGAMTAGTTVAVDSIVLDYGTTGNGFYEVNAIDGTYGQNSPYAQIVTWATHPHTGQTVNGRFGNLRGIFSVSNEFGLYVGDGTGTTNKFARISNSAAELHNIPLKLYNGTTQTVNIDSAGTDIWVGASSSDKRLTWDGSTLAVKGSLFIGTSTTGVGVSVPATLHCAFDTAPGSNIVNTNGHLGQPATVTGTGVTGTPGKYGGAAAVSEAVTNGCSNGSFETNTTGWSVVNNGTGASITIAQSPERAWLGSQSLKCIATGSSTYVHTQASVVGPSSSFNWYASQSDKPTLSAYVLVESGTWRVVFEDAGNNLRGYVELTSSSSWQRAAITVLNNFGFDYASVRVRLIPMAAGTCYVDGVLYDDSATLRPYCDSSVTAGYMSYAVTMPASWTICAWANRHTSQARNYGYIWQHSNDYSSVYYNSTGADVIGTTSAGIPSNGWHHYAITYDGTNLRSYRDGALVGTFATSYTKAQTIYVGSSGSTYQLNGEVDDFAIIPRQLTADELLAIYNSNAPLNITSGNYELQLVDPSSAAKIVAHAGGIFATDAGGKPTFNTLNSNATVNSESLTTGDTLLGDNSSGKGNVLFDQSAGKLRIRAGTTDVLTFDSAGTVDGVLALGSGGIWQGSSGSFASPTTGFKLYKSGSNGFLDLWNAGDISVRLDPASGVVIRSGSAFASDKALNFYTGGGTRTGEVYSYTDGSTYRALRARAWSDSSSQDAYAYLAGENESSSGKAYALLWAAKLTAPSTYNHPTAAVQCYTFATTPLAQVQLYVQSKGGSSATATLQDSNGTTSFTVSAGSKSWRIDDPRNPTERWIDHFTVEGPGYYTYYKGRTTLDQDGRAWVQLPDYFADINQDVEIVFSPKTGTVGNLHLANGGELVGNTFGFTGGAPGQMVSWIVTGERADPWAIAHPPQPEIAKGEEERGYLAAWMEHGYGPEYEQPRKRP